MLWWITKDHQRSSCKICSKCKFPSFKKLVVWLELNLVYWYTVRTFTCSLGQSSQVKVKGLVRSICKIAWKSKIELICRLEDQLNPCYLNRCGIRSGVNIHHLPTRSAGDTDGLRTAKYFYVYLHAYGILLYLYLGPIVLPYGLKWKKMLCCPPKGKIRKPGRPDLYFLFFYLFFLQIYHAFHTYFPLWSRVNKIKKIKCMLAVFCMCILSILVDRFSSKRSSINSAYKSRQ